VAEKVRKNTSGILSKIIKLEIGWWGQKNNNKTLTPTTLAKLTDSTILEKKGARDLSESSVK
jgi:hypothetical protein